MNELELKLQEITDKELELERIKANIDDTSLEILLDLSKQGDLDPWDIDLEKVTTKYLEAISKTSGDSLKEAGRAIFYASVLLRMKSDLLVEQGQEALRIGLHRELDDDYLLEEELANRHMTQITFNDLENALRRKYIQKAKRFRKLTLQDLIKALQEAKEEEENKILRQQQKLFDFDSYSIVAPELEGDILDLTHSENLEGAIERLRAVLPEHLIEGKGIEFTNIVRLLGDWSNAFLATIFLAHENEIKLDQKEFYKELWVYEPNTK